MRANFSGRSLPDLNYAVTVFAYLLAGLYAFGNVLLSNILPYFTSKSPYTFRTDNFWSYSSGFTRRGLPGELLIWLNEVSAGNGPFIFSAIVSLLFIVTYVIVLSRLFSDCSGVSSILLALSPILLFFQIDAEIFMLLPLLVMCFTTPGPSMPLVLALIGLSIAFREASILLYFPVIVKGFFDKRAISAVISAAIIGLFIISISLQGEDLSYRMERDYWPAFGITDLLASHLYSFSDLPLSETISFHLEMISRKFVAGGASLIAFFFICTITIYLRSRSLFLVLYFSCAMGVMGILTVDYGRYYYLFFFAAVLMSDQRAMLYVILEPIKVILDEKLVNSRLFAKWRCDAVRLTRIRTLALLVICLAPTGFYIGSLKMTPQFVRVVSEFLVRV